MQLVQQRSHSSDSGAKHGGMTWVKCATTFHLMLVLVLVLVLVLGSVVVVWVGHGVNNWRLQRADEACEQVGVLQHNLWWKVVQYQVSQLVASTD